MIFGEISVISIDCALARDRRRGQFMRERSGWKNAATGFQGLRYTLHSHGKVGRCGTKRTKCLVDRWWHGTLPSLFLIFLLVILTNFVSPSSRGHVFRVSRRVSPSFASLTSSALLFVSCVQDIYKSAEMCRTRISTWQPGDAGA